VGFFKAMMVALVLVFTLTAPTFGQNQTSQAFWETGNTFLSRCDESSADFAQLAAKDKQTWTVVCNFWILGIRQGIEMTQQIRPEPAPASPAVQKALEEHAKAVQEATEDLGIKPAFSTPSGNMCIPDDVTINQLRLVVVQWMKSNPTKLGQHGAWLAYVALTNTYACPVKKGSQ